MEASLHYTTKVLPGSRIEIVDSALREGDDVDVFLVTNKTLPPQRQSVLEIIESLGGRRHFQTPEKVDRYLREERESWDR